MRKIGMSVVLFALFILFLPNNGTTSSLTVGTKVIYPGGTDQPPKEKDTGVSLKVESVRVSDPDSEEPQEYAEEEFFDKMLNRGDAKKLLQIVSRRNDATGKAYTFLALAALDRSEEAVRLGNELIKRDDLNGSMKDQIQTKMDAFKKETGK